MELEVGMYVRTKWGIAKIREVEVVEEILGREVQPITVYYVDRCFQPIDETKCFKEDILKTSHNIIDIIEVGDYVNGERVGAVEKYEESKLTVLALFEDYCTQQNIKSIVTKEQFESMAYHVGDIK